MARLQAHPFFFVLGVLGSIASVIGLAVYFFQLPSHEGDHAVRLDEVEVIQRGPVWGNDHYDDDEVVVNIQGVLGDVDAEPNDKLVAFWRLANAHESNWHVGKRRIGSNYELATLEVDIARAGRWDFVVGGIETDKTYDGSILIIVCLMDQEAVESSRRTWLKDELGWGFEEIPQEGRIAASPPTKFNVTAVR